MSISSKVQKLLLAKSGGYCQNPGCNGDIFHYFEDGKLTSIEELAHIIAQQVGGPRGSTNEKITNRDEYENILVLCPSCHSLVDKEPEQFPIGMLRSWKTNHENRIKSVFQAPIYPDRNSLRTEISRLLTSNKAIFDQYGPQSEFAQKSVQSEAFSMWKLKSIETIIPNNRRVLQLLETNFPLLNEDEQKTLATFKIHKEGFEYNKLSGDKNPTVPLFPNEILNILQ